MEGRRRRPDQIKKRKINIFPSSLSHFQRAVLSGQPHADGWEGWEPHLTRLPSADIFQMLLSGILSTQCPLSE